MRATNVSRLVRPAPTTAILWASLFGSNAGAQTTGYWHTSGNQILNASNKAVRMSGVNWYGFETTDEVVHAINADLKGLNSLQILDKIIAGPGAIGLQVILDDHCSSAGNSTESGLWYTSAYPESAWIADLKTITTRYLNDW